MTFKKKKKVLGSFFHILVITPRTGSNNHTHVAKKQQ